MKEKIYTIPVSDAYSTACECPLCELRRDVEKYALDYYLGPSLMEPDTRKLTNSTGFCGEHLAKLYEREINRLGLGLMLHTHMLDLEKDLKKDLLAAAPAPGTLFKGKDRDYKKNLDALADRIDHRLQSCIICEKIDFTMDRYLDVLLWMYFEDAQFRARFSEYKHHCLPHLAFLLRGAGKYLSQNQASEFVAALVKQQTEGMSELTEDLAWFTLKFDYRNKDKPWGNSKTAIPRTISYLSEEGGMPNGD